MKISSVSLARRPFWLIPLVLGLLVVCVPLFSVGNGLMRIIVSIALLAMLVVGMNVTFGYAGELALGYPFVYAVAAYAAGALAVRGFDMPVTFVVAFIVAAGVGFLTGVPGVRLGSWSLAMVTFFLVLLIPNLVTLLPGITGGSVGLAGIPRPSIFGAHLNTEQYYVLVVVVAIIFFALIRNYVTSRHGAALKVMRESPVLAHSLGYSVSSLKLTAFLVGSLPAAAAGSLLAYQDGYLSAHTFSFALVVTVIAASILGGTASVYGAVIGATILVLGPLRATVFQEWSLIIYGLLLVLGGLFFRGGIAELSRRLFYRWFVREEMAPDVKELFETSGSAMRIDGGELEMHGIVKRFGGNVAVRNVDFEAKSGQVTGLIGPNGSGKTTLLNMASGFYLSDEGTVKLNGNEITNLSAHRVSRAGVSRTFQTPLIPNSMTVAEVVASARYARSSTSTFSAMFSLRGSRNAKVEDRREALQLLSVMGIVELADRPASSLPLGTRRLVEVARALVGNPSLILLDEPASGLDEQEVETLSNVIDRLRKSGATIVLVEHNFEMVMSLADTVNVLHLGKIIASGPPSQVRNDPEVIESYLGKAARERLETGSEK